MRSTLLIMFAAAALLFACTPSGPKSSFQINTDIESIKNGEGLFNTFCRACHVIKGAETFAGPGLAGILKREKLPVSKRPATPENIIRQLKTPYDRMPAFPYLSEDDIQNLLAYMNTL